MMLLTLLLSLPQASAPAELLVSTTDGAVLRAARAAGESDLLSRRAGGVARPWVPARAWQALLGDRDGDGLPDLPEGVDALCFAPGTGALPSVADLWFSTDRNGPGYRDGDILRLGAVGALQVVYAEADLVAALAPVSGTVDVDALAVEAGGVLLLSLRDSLTGTPLGDLDDGAVFSWDPRSGALALVADEAQVQAWVTHATGSSAAIGDLKGLDVDAASGELLFTVQSPGDRDGSVFGSGGGGRMLPGWEESAWGIADDFELDALALAPAGFTQTPVLESPLNTVTAGMPVRFTFAGGAADEGVVALLSPEPAWERPGVAGFVLQVADRWAPDALALPLAGDPPLRTDALGRASYAFRLPPFPPALLGKDLLLQAAGGRSGLSTPLRWRLQ